MQARAQLRYMRSSPQKVRLLADMVRGRQVDRALVSLRLSSKYAARDVEKLIRSALANLEQANPGVSTAGAVVSTITVDDGPRWRRGRPASKWVRMHRILKRQCHVTVEVALEQS